MDNRILWDIIDGLRDEIRELKAELDKVNKGNIDGIVDVGLDNEC